MKAKSFSIPIYRLKLVKDGTARLPSNTIETPETAAALVSKLIGSADREYFAAVFLNVGGVPVGVHVIGIGGLAGAQIHAREVFKAAIIANAHTMILAHNHPSGNVTPSDDDLRTTARLVEASKLLGIPIVDHIIVSTGNRFASMLQRGLLKAA
jgi:DNA repair protein RadC